MLRNIPVKLIVLLLGLASIGLITLPSRPVAAANPTTINFQGKIVNFSGGTNVTDGTYSIVFRIYNTASPTPTTACGSDATCLFEETQGSVTVTSGVFQVELGSTCSGGLVASNTCTKSVAGGINFNTNPALYLTMQFNGDTSGSHGGFMWPVIHMTTVPYAYNADNLGGIGASGFIQNGTGVQTSSNFHISAIGQADGQFQAPTFDVITSNTAMGIGTTNASTITIGNTANSTEVFKTKSSVSAFQVQNAGSASIFNIDSTNSRIGVDITYASMGLPSSVTAGAATSGGSLTAGTYYYYVTAIDSVGGETSAVESTQGTTASTNLTLPLSWTGVTDASGYRIYREARNSSPGSTGSYLTTVLGTSFGDNGSITLGSATQPGTNTAYVPTNTSNNLGQLSIGGNGTPTGQLYVSGTVPASPTNTIATGTSPNGLAVLGHYAYVVNGGSSNMQIFDINNPASPVLISTTSTGNLPSGIVVQGHYAYIITGTSHTMEIYDVSNPFNPGTAVSSIALGASGTTLAVQGRYAYVASSSDDFLQVYDIVNPASPVRLSHIYTATSVNSVFVSGRYVYVTSGGGAMLIYDASNPANIVQVGSVGSGSNNVYVSGRYAYVAEAGANSLEIFDISNPASPVSTSSISTGGSSSPHYVYVQGRYAYVADQGTANIRIIDISNPAAPVSVGTITTGTNPHIAIAQGRYLYAINSGSNTLQTFDTGGAYIQQLEAGGVEAGTLQVDTNGQVAGDFNIQGGLSVGQSLQASGNIGVLGGVNVQGSTILGGGNNSLGAPGAPTVTCQTSVSGCTTSTSWAYVITALNASGAETSASVAGTISASDGSSLTSNTYNHLSWSTVTGASGGYRIYRTTAGGTPNTTGLIGSVPGGTTTFDDTGFTGNTSTPPTIDTTGQLTVRGSVTFANSTNSTTAFQVQNATGNELLTVDTSANDIVLGKKGASGINGALVFNTTNASNTTVTIAAASTGTSYSLTLPTTGPSTSQCLQTDSSVASQLKFGSCSGGGATLQTAYDSSTGSTTPEIILNNGGDTAGLDIQNNNGSPVTGSLFAVRDKAASNLGSILFSVADTGATSINTNAAALTGLTVASPVTAAIGNQTNTGISVTSGAVTETGIGNIGNYIGADITNPALSLTVAGGLNAYGLRVTTGNLSQSAGALVQNGVYVDSGATTFTGGGTLNGVNVNVGAIAVGTYRGLNISTNGTGRTFTAGAAVTGANIDLNNNVTANGVTLTGLSVQTAADTAIAASTKTGLSISSGAITETTANTGTYVGADITVGALTSNASATALNAYGLRVTTGNLTQTAGTLTQNGILVDSGATTYTTGGTLNGININVPSVAAGFYTGLKINASTSKTFATNQITTGLNIDLNTNVTANTQFVTGLSIATPADTSLGTATKKGLQITSGNLTNNSATTGIYVGSDITLGALTTNTNGSAVLNAYGLRITTGNLTQTTGTLTENGIYVDSGATTFTTGGTLNGVNVNVGAVAVGTYKGLNISTNGTARIFTAGASITGINLDLNNNVTATGVTMTGLSVQTAGDSNLANGTKTGISVSSGIITDNGSFTGTYAGIDVTVPQTVMLGGATLNAYGLRVTTGAVGSLVNENGILVNIGGTVSSASYSGLKIAATSAQSIAASNITGETIDLNTNITANGITLQGLTVATPGDTAISVATKKEYLSHLGTLPKTLPTQGLMLELI